MSISVISGERVQTVDSKAYAWCAIANAIIQKFRRIDITFSSIANDSGYCKLTVSDSSDLVEYHYLWIDFSGAYTDGYYEILDITDGTHIIIDLAYISSASGNIISIEDLKPNYYLEVVLLLNNTDIIATLYGYTDRKGYIYVDFAPFLRSSLEKANDGTYSGEYTDVNLALNGYYNYKYKENWDSSGESYITNTTKSYVLFAAMQLQAEYGINMVNHTPMPGVNRRCDYLTAFVRPKIFYGMKFDIFMPIDYLWNAEADMTFVQIQKDINGTDGTVTVSTWNSDTNYNKLVRKKLPLSSVDADLSQLLIVTAESNHITGFTNGQPWLSALNTLTAVANAISEGAETTGNGGWAMSDNIGAVKEGSKVLFYASDFATWYGDDAVKLKIVTTGGTLNSEIWTIAPGLSAHAEIHVFTILADAAVAYLAIGYNNTDIGKFMGTMTAGILVMDEKYIDYDSCEYDNNVYLAWLNRYGGLDYWLFHSQQGEGIEVSGEVMDRYIDDLSDDQTIQDILFKEAVETKMIGVNHLTSQQLDGLKGLLYSPFVQMLMPDGVSWQTVIVRDDSWELKNTKEKLFSLELIIELPKLIIQQ